MSTNERARTADIQNATVDVLRADDDLAARLYDDPPAEAAERMRVHEAWGGPEDTPPIEVVVAPIGGGGDWNGGGALTKTTQLQCSTVTTEAWRRSNGITAMRRIRDRVEAVLESPVAKGVYPAGGSGQESPLDTPDESNRQHIPITVDVRTHHMTY